VKIEAVIVGLASKPLLDGFHAFTKGLLSFHQRFEHEHGGKQGVPLW
jgi:hypothetical protein